MLNTFQVFDVRTDLAYKGYRFESRVRHQSSLILSGDLFCCQTSRSIEIIFSLTLALIAYEVSVHVLLRWVSAKRVYH